jgi:hypothetical protein
MDNNFIVAGIVSLLFLLAKFVEMRFIDKENKPLKVLMRDTLVVFLSAVSGMFVFDQFKPGSTCVTQVFTDTPGF